MAMRIDRIEARVDPERAERIRYAARLAHTSVSAFVVDAAAEAAERVIAEQRVTVVPSDFFDALVAALDEPGEPAPALERAAKRVQATLQRRG